MTPFGARRGAGPLSRAGMDASHSNEEDTSVQRTKPVYAGVAGWSYADWRDTVYRLPVATEQLELFGNPKQSRARYVPDELAFLAQYVDMIEINSSFYRVPSVKTTHSWAKRVAHKPGFFFTAKLHQRFTHEFVRDTPMAGEFRAAFDPLSGSGLLRGLLAQFRYDFADGPEARRMLTWIADQFSILAPLIVEVRHISWERPQGLGFLRDLGATVANLDYPTSCDSFNPQKSGIGDNAYLRLHGRNRGAWFSSEASVAETYNYNYSDGEIQQLAQRSLEILGDVTELTIVANNHYQGKAVSAALRLKAEITDEKLDVPPALLETYPNLKRLTPDAR